MRIRSLFIALVATAACAVVAPPALALSPDGTASALARQMRHAGGASGALVVDLDSGSQVYGLRTRTRRMPASVEKLFTTSTALLRLGAGARLRTEVRAVAPVGLDGTLDGDLYLHGGGDPTLTTTGLRSLARSLVRSTGLSRVTGRVVGDESAFDRLRGVPSAGYAISVDVQPLGALMVDRGRTGRAAPYYQAAPASWAATRFADALRAAGVDVARKGRAGTSPPGALTIGVRRSPTMARMIQLTNVPSDNYMAETLLKAIAAQEGTGTTARGASLVERTVDDEFGLAPQVIDGSGLSRSDRTTPTQVVRLLQGMMGRDEGVTLHASLAVAGRSGTLRDRLRSSVARDRCRGKTGTLHDVSNLAGICVTPSGSRVAFAILMNYVSPWTARRLQDRMVSAISRYEPAG
jgi:serine-type D-Ala-D-Ala carboxypeptidase/endopeptidase (penicillin-binding protein 4)